MNLFENIDLKDGVLSNPDACIRTDIELELQTINLIEDIVQINFKHNNSFIDIGWYPTEFEVNKKSFFLVRICSDGNWDNLVYEKNATQLKI